MDAQTTPINETGADARDRPAGPPIHPYEVLAAASRVITSSPRVEDVYEDFAREVRRLLEFDRIAIVGLDESEETVTTLYGAGMEIYPSPCRGLKGSLIEYVMAGRSPVLLTTSRSLRQPLRDDRGTSVEFGSTIVAPLVSQDHFVGALILRAVRPDVFVDRDLETVGQLAAQIAGPIFNARLLEKDRQAQAALERSIVDRIRAEEAARDEARISNTLARIGASIASDLDLDRIVQEVTDAATELSGAEFGAFFYNQVNEQGESFLLYKLSGVPREAFAGLPQPRNTELFGPTFSGAGIVRLDDVTQDPRYSRNEPYHGIPPGHLPVRGYLAVPVVSRSGPVLGGLFLGHRESGRFTERHERIVSGIAQWAAITMDNAQLFRESRETQERLQEALRQKETLLREVHRRVKNNMQVISSLLDLQGAQTDDPEVSRMLLESTARVQLMALVHQRLYSAEDLDRIDLGGFIQEVVPDLVQMYRDPGKAICVSVQADSIETDMDCAILCGLIVNETLSNALKHAFPDRKEGSVHVAVGQEAGGHITLRVSDDGVGLPPEFDLKQAQTLGMQLTYSLSRQLKASVEVDTGKGTAFTITFDR